MIFLPSNFRNSVALLHRVVLGVVGRLLRQRLLLERLRMMMERHLMEHRLRLLVESIEMTQIQ